MTNQAQQTEAVTPKQIAVGDTIRFYTADNGFCGSGGHLHREAVVVKVSAKSIRAEIYPGKFAVIRYADWYSRDVRKVVQP